MPQPARCLDSASQCSNEWHRNAERRDESRNARGLTQTQISLTSIVLAAKKDVRAFEERQAARASDASHTIRWSSSLVLLDLHLLALSRRSCLASVFAFVRATLVTRCELHVPGLECVPASHSFDDRDAGLHSAFLLGALNSSAQSHFCWRFASCLGALPLRRGSAPPTHCRVSSYTFFPSRIEGRLHFREDLMW